MRVVTVQRKRQLSCFFWRRGLFFLQSSLTNSGVHGRFTLGRMPPISCCYSIIACKWLNQQPQAVIRTAVFSCFQCFSVQLKTRADVNYSWPHLQISPQSSPTALTWTLQLHLWRLTPSPHCWHLLHSVWGGMGRRSSSSSSGGFWDACCYSAAAGVNAVTTVLSLYAVRSVWSCERARGCGGMTPLTCSRRCGPVTSAPC